jgi:hypothetical protein
MAAPPGVRSGVGAHDEPGRRATEAASLWGCRVVAAEAVIAMVIAPGATRPTGAHWPDDPPWEPAAVHPRVRADPSCARLRTAGVRAWWRPGRSRPMSQDRQPAPSGQQQPPTGGGEPTHRSAGARSPGRRGFLLGAGGLAAAALVGGGGWLVSEQTTSAGPTTQSQPGGSGSALDVEARRTRALELRITTARQQLGDRSPTPNPTATRPATPTTLSGWPPSPRPCPTTTSARSTRQRTGRCRGRCGAAAQRISGASRWAAG